MITSLVGGMQPLSTTLVEAGEHVARTGLPARRQFFVVAEDRARAGGLRSLAKSVTRQLIAPRDMRASLVSWINFVFLPEAVNRWEASGVLPDVQLPAAVLKGCQQSLHAASQNAVWYALWTRCSRVGRASNMVRGIFKPTTVRPTGSDVEWSVLQGAVWAGADRVSEGKHMVPAAAGEAEPGGA